HVIYLLAGCLVSFALLMLLFRRGRWRHLFFLLGFWRSRMHLGLRGLAWLCRLRRYRCFCRRRCGLGCRCCCRFFLFRYLCLGTRFAFRPKPAPICYYKLCLLLSHAFLILFRFETAGPLLWLQRRLIQSLVPLQLLRAARNPT